MTAPARSAGFRWVVAILAIAVYGILARDGRHHWHEFRYLHSAANYTTHQLMSGAFDPGPSPVRTPRELAEWNCTEILHEGLLRIGVFAFGHGLGGYSRIEFMYGLLPLLSVLLLWQALRSVTESPRVADPTAALLLLSPVTVYLGFNLMGEVPGLFFQSVALWIYSRGISSRIRRLSAAVSTGVFLALSALCSVKMPLIFLGFWTALFTLRRDTDERNRLLGSGVVAWLSFVGFWFLGFELLGGDFSIYFDALLGFLSFTKHLPMLLFALFNIGLFGMALWILASLAVLSKQRDLKRFFGIWLAVSTLPVLVAGINFLEPRYLITGAIPLAGLACLGLLWLLDSIPSRSGKVVAGSTSALLVVAGTAGAQWLMPYESEAPKLVEAVQRETNESDLILVPWNYSDFHFLRFVFPHRPVFLVQSPVDSDGRIIRDAAWTSRRLHTYARHYLPERTLLERTTPGRRVYIGFAILPSLQNLVGLLRMVPIKDLPERIGASRFMVHQTQSWLWHDPHYDLAEIAQHGPYHVYEVRARDRFP